MKAEEIKNLSDGELNDMLILMQGGCSHENAREGYTDMGLRVKDCGECGASSDDNPPTIWVKVDFVTNPADNAQLEKQIVAVYGAYAYGEALMGFRERHHNVYKLFPADVAKVAMITMRGRAEAALALIMQAYEANVVKTKNPVSALAFTAGGIKVRG